jgi:hypothetical protein
MVKQVTETEDEVGAVESDPRPAARRVEDVVRALSVTK